MQQRTTNQTTNSSYSTASTQAAKSVKAFFKIVILLLGMITTGHRSLAQGGTWTPLTNMAPDFNGGVMLLLTDGTVMIKTYSGSTYGNIWDKLTPDASGSYVNGTWSATAAMHDDRVYFSSQVLRDGRVYVAGGESGSGATKSEVYNPLTNTWSTPLTVPGSGDIYDGNSEMLPDGRVLQAIVSGGATGNYFYDPVENTYAAAPSSFGCHDESAWLKLPDNSILFVDIASTSSERYIPSTNTWVHDANLPVALYDTFDYESGAAFMLPNGKAFFIGSTSNTAIYTPSGTSSPGTWAAGPTIPAGMGAPDAAAAMMVNGKVLCAFSHTPTYSGDYADSTYYYEYDYVANAFTLVGAPGGAGYSHYECYMSNMLDLPDGTVLFADQGTRQYYEYTPSGTALTSGKPTVSTISRTNCDTFLATGTLFTGISEGANFGDDWQMSSNYPIIRLTSGTNVYYARSFNWNRVGAVMTGSLADTAQFVLPSGLPAGTYSLAVVVNGNPSAPFSFNPGYAISPSTASVSAGGTTTLTDPMSGGAWTTGNSAIATIGSATGIVTGVAAGSVIITYSSTGCTTTAAVAVTGGSTALCIGATATLTDLTTGGTWTSNNTGIATVTSGGIVTGVSAGTDTVLHYLMAGGSTTKIVVVSMAPSAVSGGSGVCQGSTLSLSDAVTGGTWSSAATSITVSSSTGVISGIAAGTATVTYSIGSCLTTKALTVNPVAPITGGSSLCLGSTLLLSDAISGGTWSSGSAGVATISSAGVAGGLTSGTSVIDYTLPSGCSVTSLVIVNPGPAPISSSANICIGSAVTLSTSPSGGSWVSGAPALATVNSTTGVVTGLASGTTIVTYTIGTGCITTTSIAVNSVPAAISGPASVCAGSTIALTESGSGSWSSSNTSVATVDYSGNVTGVSSGIDTIAYVLSSGCAASTVVTVNAVPASISGTAVLCNAATSTLSDGVAGGAWSSDNTSIANVGAGTGIVTGSSAGTATIYYSIGTCSASAVVTINPSPATITGTASACMGLTTTLGDATAGGTWNSSNTAVAAIDATAGIITGILPGTTTVSYALSTGCLLTKTVTINNIPSAITGTGVLCAGTTVTLSDAAAGGTWSSGNTAIANIVSATGILTGISTGTVAISYAIGACSVSAIVTVNAAPSAISGNTPICFGSTATLSESASGGTWSSSNVSVATVLSGTVTGVSSGTATLLYTNSGGCVASVIATVNPLPAAIGGAVAICAGSTTTLTNGTASGTWSSSNVSVANIASGTGVATGITAGTATISYVLATGCSSAAGITVNPTPAAISGTATACAGATTTLGSATTGGSWTSSNTATANVVNGIVTGVSSGSVNILYTNSAGCVASKGVTINPVPAAIGGTATVCIGSTITLTDGTASGTWSSSSTSIANIVSGTGVASGTAMGTATISYALATGCSASKVVTVNSVPAAISGTATVCVGSNTTLSDGTGGGAWTSSNTAKATVANGIVAGVSSGAATITYAITAGCPVSATVTVNAVPSAITGAASACTGSTTTLSDPTTNGTWSSSNTSIAAIVSGTGVVTGASPGTATMSYSLTTGCKATAIVTVNPVPAAIGGAATVCTGSTATLTDGTGGGTWLSSSTAKITVSGGVISGAAAGTATISYSLGTGCRVTKPITVNASPSSISGTTTVCIGATAALSDAGGGTWSSSNAALASVNASTGKVKGIAAGTPIITYRVSDGCVATRSITIHSCARTMDNAVCIGSTINLNEDASAGTWSSSNNMIAKVDEATGTVSGISAGNVTITYVAGSENTLIPVSVYPAPAPVTLTASPSANIEEGQSVTCTATGTGDVAPSSYQWLINGNQIEGANSATFTNGSFADNDVVACQVTGLCGEVPVNNTITIKINQHIRQITPTGSDIRILPNPNNGSFTIKGAVGVTGDEEVSINITDMVGRVIYTDHFTAHNGNIDEKMQLNSTLANGTYILDVHSATTNTVLHIVVEQ